MKQNLDTLKEEIQQFVEAEGFVLFQGEPRLMESFPFIRWNTNRYPDFHPFLEAARSMGARVIVFHAGELDASVLDTALEDLEATDMPREDIRRYERRIRELRAYEGFTFEIELSFDHENRTYVFELQTDWYAELGEILDEIDIGVAGDDEEDGPLGGFYSNN